MSNKSEHRNTDAYMDMLGKVYKDRITGYQGVVVTIAFDLFGCVQAILKPPIDKDGKIQDGHFFDVNRLDKVDDKRVMPLPSYAPLPEQHTHGPATKPKARAQ